MGNGRAWIPKLSGRPCFATALLLLVSMHAAVGCIVAEVGVQSRVVVTEADNGRSVVVKAGDSLTISLSENATTGYTWAVEPLDGNVVELVDTPTYLASPQIGSGGRREFTFVARRNGQGTIRLQLWRHWEGDASIIDRFAVHLVVR